MNKLKIIISILVCIFYTVIAWSNKKIQIYEVPLDIKTIRIQVSNSNIKVLPITSKKNELKIKNAHNFTIKEKNSVLIISENSFLDQQKKSLLKKNLVKKKLVKKLKVIIRVPPSIPVEIAAIGTVISIHKLKKTNLLVSMIQKGTINIKNTKGKLNIFQKKGDINIDSHKGELNIQAEDSDIFLTNHKGKININSLKGSINILKSQGTATLYSFKSPIIFDKFLGFITFKQEKGGVRFKQVNSVISGYSKFGKLRGSMHPNKITLKTKSGDINISFTRVRAWVTAETQEGRIYAPVYFHRIKTGGIDRSKGRLRGVKGQSIVSLKSYSGSIRVFQQKNIDRL